ncbi:hypothetical protein HDU81_002104 [Chytriomyces hyalinus]|nr:hypothetical protein HDU81_002104 [Chytriomyces hyalinus]
MAYNDVSGFLIDKFASFGDFFNGSVFVSHGGGRSRPRAAMLGQGGFTLSKDFELEDSQEESDKSIAGLIKAKESCSPVVVIMGSQYPLIQDANLPGRYNILGSYLVRDYWASKEYGETLASDSAPSLEGPAVRSYHIRYKFKFQASSSVYRERICLNPSCADFFVVIDEVTGARSDLDVTQTWNDLYDAEFVKPWIADGTNEKWPPDTIIPPPLKGAGTCNVGASAAESNGTTGNAGIQFALYVSLLLDNNTCCSYSHCIQTEPIVYDMKSTIPALKCPSEKRANGLGYMHSSVLSKSLHAVLRQESVFSANPTTAYTLPNGGGTILHIRNSGHTNSIADEILNSFVQADNLPLSRQTFRQHQGKLSRVINSDFVSFLSSILWIVAGFLSQQFSYNVGAAYRYASSHVATEISDAPAPVQMALEHLKNLIPGYSFNEYLVLGYLKGIFLDTPLLSHRQQFNIIRKAGQKMNFHSDDEPGLGASVASWSFGSEAEMCFRDRTTSKRSRNDTLTNPSNSDATSLLNYNLDACHAPIPSKNESFQTFQEPLTFYPPLSHIGRVPFTTQKDYLSTVNSRMAFPLSYDFDYQKMLSLFKRDALIPIKREISGFSATYNPSPKRSAISINTTPSHGRLFPNARLGEEKDAMTKQRVDPTIFQEMVPQRAAIDASTTKPTSGVPAKMNESGKKEVQRVCLKLTLRHGDVLIMVSGCV